MSQFKSYLFIFVFCLLNTPPILASNGDCPKEAIHCLYRSPDSQAKWIKVVMLPRQLSMVLCLRPHDVVYLEKDDVEQDGTLPGSILTWEVSQCLNEQCSQSRLIGIDQFKLLLIDQHYTANPPDYRFTVDTHYGETCTT
jgi:hypothetical protein